MNKVVNIIGGGLAGCECAYQLAKRGINVILYDMKPKLTEAHKNTNLAELVCSNSLKSNEISTAGGLLKQELRELDSLLIKVADSTRVPAGSSLSVDREKFSKSVTSTLRDMSNIKIISQEITNIDTSVPTVIATGPLTSNALASKIIELVGEEELYFFDAIAPIVSFDSINFDIAYVKDRYDKGDGDYINCPFTKDEYLKFYNELINGEIVQLKDFEKNKVY
ncbi:MAG: methylenetetrahydrofolate--tRNA-(uracil(54)-C(5))-methyltransferase (FADH(2)-oxidizing) TrmFO, partial [Christensenellales bacterium]